MHYNVYTCYDMYLKFTWKITMYTYKLKCKYMYSTNTCGWQKFVRYSLMLKNFDKQSIDTIVFGF